MNKILNGFRIKNIQKCIMSYMQNNSYKRGASKELWTLKQISITENFNSLETRLSKMKRSSSSQNNSTSSKRFESLRSSPQLQLQQQLHQKMQHMHQQQLQHPNDSLSSGLSVNQFFSSMTSPSPGISRMQYSSSKQSNNALLYNAAVGILPNPWKYPPPTSSGKSVLGIDVGAQPPMPLAPPPQPPPLPPIESFESRFAPGTPLYHNKHFKASVSATRSLGTDEISTQSCKKSRRKPSSNRYGQSKEWSVDDALKAIALEKEYSKKSNSEILLLRFPDPELNQHIVSEYSSQIETVNFQHSSMPRYCFVTLKEGADAIKVRDEISKIPFGSGFVKAELKRSQHLEPPPVNPEEIDPYTLYVGNLPTSISSRIVKEHFPGAHRIDIGFAQRMKFTRYAFVRYDTFEEAANAFRKSVNTPIDHRSPIVRFRRQNGNMTFPEQTPPRKEPVLDERSTETLGAVEALKTDSCTATKEQDSNRSVITAAIEGKKDEHIKETTEVITPPLANDINLLDAILTGTTFDSPASLEEPERIQVDSKANVVRDAEKLNQDRRTVQRPNRRSSVEEMFEELERRQHLLTTARPSTAVRIKEELDDLDDISEDEEEPQLNLLGSRYKNEDAQIKTEPDLSPHNDESVRKDVDNFPDDFDFDDELEDFEPEEEDDEDWPVSGSNLARNANWEAVKKTELLDTEYKPDVANLSNKINSCGSVHFNSRDSDVEKLYEQRRRFKEYEINRKPRDELDRMFAQMNSDGEDDEDFF